MNTVCMISGINGVLIEARYHAAEAFCSPHNLLNDLCESQAMWKELRDLLFTKYIMDDHDETHGIGWKIWSAIGVGPQTGLMPNEMSARLIQKKKLKSG